MDNDLISRQAAIDAFRKELCKEHVYATPFVSLKGCERILNELPSAERHGRWIHRPVEEWGASNCKCSVCGTEYFFPLLLKGGADNYCGNCGARMVEK